MTIENIENKKVETANDKNLAEGENLAQSVKSAQKKYRLLSKTVYKQTLKSNWKLWSIFTSIMVLMLVVMILTFDPIAMSKMRDAMENMMGGRASEMMGDLSLNGNLAQGFFGMLAVLLPMIYVMITANGLIASQVDRGSMAYTLSTPIKRKTVVTTQATYLISTIVAMFLIITIVGLGTIQIAHGSVFGTAYPADITAISKELNKKEQNISYEEILAKHELIVIGAEARKIDEDTYKIYLENKIYGSITENPENITKYSLETQMLLAPMASPSFQDDIVVATLRLDGDVSKFKTLSETEKENVIKDLASFPTVAAFDGIVTFMSAQSQVSLDDAYDFNAGDFLMMILGAFLFAFAIASISFFFSSLCNLSKNSVALGVGIPVGFYLLDMISKITSSLEWLKYLSLNTLFNPSMVISGGVFWWQFLFLGALGVGLFTAAINIFKKKDLPL